MEVDEHDDEADDRLLNGLMDAIARAYGLEPTEPEFISDLVFPKPVKCPDSP